MRAGVFGIARTQREWSNQFSILLSRIPAAMLMMSRRCASMAFKWGARDRATCLKSWGFTAMTRTCSSFESICSASIELTMATEKSALSFSAVAVNGSTTVICLACKPLANKPPISARPILPPPIKVMCVCAKGERRESVINRIVLGLSDRALTKDSGAYSN